MSNSSGPANEFNTNNTINIIISRTITDQKQHYIINIHIPKQQYKKEFGDIWKFTPISTEKHVRLWDFLYFKKRSDYS